jgi:hypothetical protein
MVDALEGDRSYLLHHNHSGIDPPRFAYVDRSSSVRVAGILPFLVLVVGPG